MVHWPSGSQSLSKASQYKMPSTKVVPKSVLHWTCNVKVCKLMTEQHQGAVFGSFFKNPTNTSSSWQMPIKLWHEKKHALASCMFSSWIVKTWTRGRTAALSSEFACGTKSRHFTSNRKQSLVLSWFWINSNQVASLQPKQLQMNNIIWKSCWDLHWLDKLQLMIQRFFGQSATEKKWK